MKQLFTNPLNNYFKLIIKSSDAPAFRNHQKLSVGHYSATSGLNNYRHAGFMRPTAWCYRDLYKILTLFEVDLATKRNEYREYSCGEGRPARRADSLTAICEPIV
jgi:hypothetical protein